MRGHQRAAAAINDKIKRQADRVQRKRQVAEVRGINPLKLVPLDLDYALNDGDVTLSQAVEAYNEDEGLRVGDNVIIDQVSGNWVATDVITNKTRSLKKDKNGQEFTSLAARLNDLEDRIKALEDAS